MDHTHPTETGMRQTGDTGGNAPPVVDAADFRALVELGCPLAWIDDIDGNLIWSAPRWAVLADLPGESPPEPDAPLDWAAALHDGDRARIVEAIREARHRHGGWRGAARLADGTGGHTPHDITYLPAGTQTGARWIGVASPQPATSIVERALALRERRYRSLVQAVAEIVWQTSAAGVLHGDQTAWLQFTGQRADDLDNAGWLDAIHPDDRELTFEAWRRAVEQKSVYEVEHRLRRWDGEWRHCQARAAPVFDDEGQLIEWIGIHTDITERKMVELQLSEAKEAAERANLAKSQFLANMSHELRTPLSAVIGYSEMLEEEVEEAGMSHMLHDLRKINDAARHLLGLISDVLDLSKIEANRMTVYAERFGLQAMAGEIVSTVGTLVARRDNRLEVSLPEADIQLETDQVKLRQCLFNLIGNAAKFTEAGIIGLQVRPFVENGCDWVAFEVSDTGIGMTEAQVEGLFQRFVQADVSTTRRFGGTGLGLSLTRAFAELLGGDVGVRSELGHGSVFTLRIPATLPQAPAEDAAPVPEHIRAGEAVLVIDDDPATRDLLTRFLEREGFVPHTAADGSSGVAIAKKIRPRVILLDVVMPGMDGWSVLGAIRSEPEIAATPVVMISFVHEEGLAASLGANDYLVKPIEWSTLHDVLSPYRRDASGGILVVEDDAEAARRMVAMLDRIGVTGTVAANGIEALAAVAANPPSLILLDLMMPEMDGFEFLRHLRADPRWNDIRVVVFSAMDIPAAQRRHLEGQVEQVIMKGSTTLRELAEQLRAMRPADVRLGEVG